MSGVSSIQFVLDFWNCFNFAKPLKRFQSISRTIIRPGVYLVVMVCFRWFFFPVGPYSFCILRNENSFTLIDVGLNEQFCCINSVLCIRNNHSRRPT